MTVVAPAGPPILQFFGDDGTFLVGGQLYTTVGGVPYPTYADANAQIQHANPIILNSRGEIATSSGQSAQLYLIPGVQYQFALFDRYGTPIDTPQNVEGLLTLSTLEKVLTPQIIGAIANPVTPEETASGVTVMDLSYSTLPFVDVRRYGVIADGMTDDTTALQNALNVASSSGAALVIPYGYTVNITNYVQVQSNTTFAILGTLQVNNRNSGLFANNSTNIDINGYGLGTITDPSVAANYDWNHQSGTNTLISPAIHIRSSINVQIHGLTFNYVCEGLQFSNATTNTATGASWSLTQAQNPTNCHAYENVCTFCELGGITGYLLQNSGYRDNYVYRCGDGGMWMMGGSFVYCINNERISPYAVPADVVTFGTNIQSQPTTWNDEQGLQFENCRELLIEGNRVQAMWAQGIDIKNNCDHILVIGNQLVDCERASICIREGDAAKNAVNKTTIIGNTISGHGTLQFNIDTGINGAIRVGEDFQTAIIDNTIYGYQTTPGINCQGPGAYMNTFATNPYQATVVVRGNLFDFKNNTQERVADIPYTSATLQAIIVNGQYTSVQVNDNNIFTDKYLSVDSRNGTSPAIQMNQVNANSTFYPTSGTFCGNSITGWGFNGINVACFFTATYSGITITGNSIAQCSGSGIYLNVTHKAVVTGNTVTQCGSGAGFPGIDIVGAAGNVVDGIICTGNSITGRFDGGTNAMNYCIRTTFASNINLANNVFAGAATATVSFNNTQGNHILTGSTGFPRTGGSTPNGVVTSYYLGEDFFDTNGHWWKASTFNSTVWTQLN